MPQDFAACWVRRRRNRHESAKGKRAGRTEPQAGAPIECPAEHGKANRRIAKLKGERRRLLDAHLAGAVPIDLLQEKQREISAQLARSQTVVEAAQGSVDQAKRGLKLTIQFLHKAGDAYHEADEITRRAWNQTFFTKLWIAPQDDDIVVVGAELTDEFAELLSDDLRTQLERVLDEPLTAAADRGSNVVQTVETAGIEPASAIA